MPAARPFVGVKVAARVRPVPVMGLRVPLVVRMSASIKSVVTSVKVKVMVAVAPAFKSEADEVMVTLGATVSMVMPSEVNPTPLLPTVSV